MKVAMLLPSLRNVGPVRVAYDIIVGLKGNNNIDFTVFYLNDIVELDFPCKVEKLTLSNVFNLYSYDVLHSHMLKPDGINALLPFFRGAKISTLHNIVEADLFYSHGNLISKLFTKVWKAFWKRMNLCAVLSHVAERYYVDLGLDAAKLEVVYNGVQEKVIQKALDPEIERKLMKLKEDYTVLGTVCLFNHRKGLDQVVRALPFMENMVFVVIGDGPVKPELIKLSRELGVEDKLIFLGFIHNAPSYLGFYDVYMMPSREEGFGLALIDAIVAQVPVVCSNIPIFRELFNDDEVAFFDLDDTNGIIEAVNSLKRNGANYSQKAKTRFIENYTRNHMSESYAQLYERKCK
ncbi:glycosyltransferase family 4 protein [Vibrio sp. 1262-1]|uniref:glycosyltransferase family 4 protein n=1 Tax=Vibrio sp. 1262-1 TaxID=3074548 RepID=UPI0029654A4D|nr:glycosyltransferase family 4 protein [Vibrio sp. 1262-1]MDW2402514.1 glycosyltransferase family 4 protein [Vibrio sp. 1262-1]